MVKRKHSIEQIIGKLRETEVELAQGRSVDAFGSTTDRAFVCAPAVRTTSGLTTSSKPALTTGGLSGC